MGQNAKSREDLQYVKAGDPVSAAIINALIDQARTTGQPFSRGSFEDQAGPQLRASVRPRNNWTRVFSPVALPPFSVLEIYDSLMLEDGLRFYGQYSGSNSRMFCGNEEYPIPAGGDGYVKLITPHDPVLVKTAAGQFIKFLDFVSPRGTNVLYSDCAGVMMAMSRQRASDGIIAVVQAPIYQIRIGKTNMTIPKNGYGSVDQYDGVSSFNMNPTGDTWNLVFNRFATVASGKWVALSRFPQGWELTAAEC